MLRRYPWKYSAVLLALPLPAQAHAIHPLWAAAALSPLLVLLLTAILGWLARSARVGGIHATLILAWVALFWLASNFVTNDYLIWAPLAMYLVHSTIIIVLIPWYAVTRRRSKRVVV